MKIVTIINGLNNGGAEKFAVELCNELAEDHQVYLLVKNTISDEMLPPKKLSDRVSLVVFDSNRKWDVVFLVRLIYKVWKLRPDVIHIHSALLVFYTFFYSVFLRKVNILQTIHSQVTPAYRKVLRFCNQMKSLGFSMEQIVISNKLMDDFTHAFPRQFFHVIDNGVKSLEMEDPVEWSQGGERLKLLAIGHYSPSKRFDDLADVLSIPEVANSFQLGIIGEEKETGKPVTEYIKKQSRPNVQLLGLQEHIGSFLKTADALVIWSSYEGMPLVMLEALSVGCPIIASPVGGIPDVIVSGENGILTNGLEQQDLILALEKFKSLSDSERARISVNNQQLFMQQYSIKGCSMAYEKLFKSVLS
ncbi:MAG: hypothetical protein RLY35_1962 [Bacteroidota bacterium]|jgi:glycosyltransferase involved in cell wall biosynthesis